MKKKNYISLVGTSTAGKTTLAQTLLVCADQDKFMVVPQVTVRPKRSDDNVALIETLDEDTFQSAQFLAKYGNYGILWKDFINFCESSQNIGLSVTGPNELKQLSKQYNMNLSTGTVQVNRINIAIRYSNNYSLHRKAANDNLKLHFNGAAADDRISINEKLDNDFYFNEDFLNENVDIVLSREVSLKEWIQQIEKKLSTQLVKGNIPQDIWNRPRF